MPRRAEHLADRAVLDDPAPVEHHHAVGDAGQRAEVVRDDHDRQAEAVPQLGEQPQDVVPVARVERADRLVAQQQLGLGGQRPGDRDPLPLAAGDLARACGRSSAASRPTLARAPVDPRLDLPAVEAAADPEPLADDVARRSGPGRASAAGPGRPAGRARGGAPCAGRAAAQAGDLGAVEDDPALPRPDQADHGAGQGGLARAGLADQADDLAGPDCRSTPDRTWLARQPRPRTTSTSSTASSGGAGRRLGLRTGGHRAASSRIAVAAIMTAATARRGRRRGRSAPGARASRARRDRAGPAAVDGGRAALGEPAAGDLRADLRRLAGDDLSSRRWKSPTEATRSSAWV